MIVFCSLKFFIRKKVFQFIFRDRTKNELFCLDHHFDVSQLRFRLRRFISVSPLKMRFNAISYWKVTASIIVSSGASVMSNKISNKKVFIVFFIIWQSRFFLSHNEDGFYKIAFHKIHPSIFRNTAYATVLVICDLSNIMIICFRIIIANVK